MLQEFTALPPVRTYRSPSVVPGVGSSLASGTHSSTPASMRSASRLLFGARFHAPSSMLSSTSEASSVQSFQPMPSGAVMTAQYLVPFVSGTLGLRRPHSRLTTSPDVSESVR